MPFGILSVQHKNQTRQLSHGFAEVLPHHHSRDHAENYGGLPLVHPQESSKQKATTNLDPSSNLESQEYVDESNLPQHVQGIGLEQQYHSCQNEYHYMDNDSQQENDYQNREHYNLNQANRNNNQQIMITHRSITSIPDEGSLHITRFEGIGDLKTQDIPLPRGKQHQSDIKQQQLNQDEGDKQKNGGGGGGKRRADHKVGSESPNQRSIQNKKTGRRVQNEVDHLTSGNGLNTNNEINGTSHSQPKQNEEGMNDENIPEEFHSYDSEQASSNRAGEELKLEFESIRKPSNLEAQFKEKDIRLHNLQNKTSSNGQGQFDMAASSISGEPQTLNNADLLGGDSSFVINNLNQMCKESKVATDEPSPPHIANPHLFSAEQQKQQKESPSQQFKQPMKKKGQKKDQESQNQTNSIPIQMVAQVDYYKNENLTGLDFRQSVECPQTNSDRNDQESVQIESYRPQCQGSRGQDGETGSEDIGNNKNSYHKAIKQYNRNYQQDEKSSIYTETLCNESQRQDADGNHRPGVIQKEEPPFAIGSRENLKIANAKQARLLGVSVSNQNIGGGDSSVYAQEPHVFRTASSKGKSHFDEESAKGSVESGKEEGGVNMEDINLGLPAPKTNVRSIKDEIFADLGKETGLRSKKGFQANTLTGANINIRPSILGQGERCEPLEADYSNKVKSEFRQGSVYENDGESDDRSYRAQHLQSFAKAGSIESDNKKKYKKKNTGLGKSKFKRTEYFSKPEMLAPIFQSKSMIHRLPQSGAYGHALKGKKSLFAKLQSTKKRPTSTLQDLMKFNGIDDLDANENSQRKLLCDDDSIIQLYQGRTGPIQVEQIKRLKSRKDIVEMRKNDYHHHMKQMKKIAKVNKFQRMDDNTLFIYSKNSPFRQLCQKIVQSKYLNHFILTCLIINCAALAFYDYEVLFWNEGGIPSEQAPGKRMLSSSPTSTSHQNSLHNFTYSSSMKLIDGINILFSVIFFIEIFIRSVYQGLVIHYKSFLRNGWSTIDLIVVLTGFLEILFPPVQYQWLRVFRTLFRPLKIINCVPRMKTLLRSLIASLPDFANVGVFMIFLFILFATMGVQQYNGAVYNSCRINPHPNETTHSWPSDLSFKRPCSMNQHGNFICPEQFTCGNIEDYDEIPMPSEHIEQRAYLNYGVTNFDHLGTSLLSVFQMITSETWHYQLMNLMDVDFPIIGALYCFAIIIVGQFFLLNLILAVIIEAFMKSHREKLEEEVRRLEYQERFGVLLSENLIEEDDEEEDEQEEDEDEDEDDEEGEYSSSSSMDDQIEEEDEDLENDEIDLRGRNTWRREEPEEDKQDQTYDQDMDFKEAEEDQEQHQPDDGNDFGTPIKNVKPMSELLQQDHKSGCASSHPSKREEVLSKKSKTGRGGHKIISKSSVKGSMKSSKKSKYSKKQTKQQLQLAGFAVEESSNEGTSSLRSESFEIYSDSDGPKTLKGIVVGSGVKIENSNNEGTFGNENSVSSKKSNQDELLVDEIKHSRTFRIKKEKTENFLPPIPINMMKPQYRKGNKKAGKMSLNIAPTTLNLKVPKKKKTMLMMHSPKFDEEERKYRNNEDFTAFLREPAQKRKIANMFVKIKKELDCGDSPSGGKNEESKDASGSGNKQNSFNDDDFFGIKTNNLRQKSNLHAIPEEEIKENQDDDFFHNDLAKLSPTQKNPSPKKLQRSKNSINSGFKLSMIYEEGTGEIGNKSQTKNSKESKHRLTKSKSSAIRLEEVIQSLIMTTNMQRGLTKKKSNLQGAESFIMNCDQKQSMRSMMKELPNSRDYKSSIAQKQKTIGPDKILKTLTSRILNKISDQDTVGTPVKGESSLSSKLQSLQFLKIPGMAMTVTEDAVVPQPGISFANFAMFNNTIGLPGSNSQHNIQGATGALGAAINKNHDHALVDLISKKFNIEVKRNIIETQEKKTTQQNAINERIQLNKFYEISYKVQQNIYFKFFMFLIIVVNTCTLLFDSYPINMENLKLQEGLNIAFASCYVFEIFIKLVSRGMKSFLQSSGMNKFDTFIVIVSILDLIIVWAFLPEDMLGNSVPITVLKAFRILRLFKLARYWRSFYVLLETIWLTLTNIVSFVCVLLVVMFIYALLGQEFFSHRSKINELTGLVDTVHGFSPPFNFDHFFDSISTVFLVLVDAQQTIFLNFYRSVSPGKATFFWVTFVILAQKVLLNLFLAHLLQFFEEGKIKDQILQKEKRLAVIRGELDPREVQGNVLEKLKERFNIRQQQLAMIVKKLFPRTSINGGLDQSMETGASPTPHKLDLSSAQKSFGSPSPSQGDGTLKRTNTQRLKAASDKMKQHYDGIALGILSKESKLRLELYNIITHKWFKDLIIVCILTSAIILALDSPLLDPESNFKSSLYWIDITTTAIFTIEAVSKLMVFGLFFSGNTSYFRELWNILDFIILVFSYLCLTPYSDNFKVVKSLRILRSLRLIGRNEGLKVAVRALFFAIPNVLEIAFMMLLFFLFFGVICVTFLKGKLQYCDYHLKEIKEHHVGKWDCQNAGGLWLNRVYNWDNIPNAFVQLFVMSTTAGWGEIMLNTLISTDLDHGPMLPNEQNQEFWTCFFILFMIVGCFFFINLFVGVVITTFHSEQERVGGGELLTSKQKEWIDLRLLVLRSAPLRKMKPPQNIIRKICYKIQEHPYFERFIQSVIILNTIVLMIKWYRQPESVDSLTEILNIIFTIIFTVEVVIRNLAIGPINYFKNGWNLFDFIVAIGSITGIIISKNTKLSIKGASLLRAFRILRLLRLLKRGGKSLYMIFNTFVITMQSLANIGGLLILIMYIYSIIGIIYFGDIKRNGNMSEYINFETFSSAFITLFTVATIDSWNLTMSSFTYSLEAWNQCVENPSFEDYQKNGYKTIGCGSKANAFLFFVSYMFIVSLVFLKLFIAIILEGYKQSQDQDTRLFNNDIREKFREVWATFDPDATTFIRLADLRDFLFALGDPLGFDDSFNDSRFLQDKFIASLELPTYHNFQSYQFLDVLDALSFRVMVLDHINKIEEEDQLREQQELEEQKQRLRQQKQAAKNGMENQLQDGGAADADQQDGEQGHNSHAALDERGIKVKIEKEVNQLIFQKQSENIVAFKELWEKEQKKLRNREKNKDQSGLTSSHHMAIEAAIRRIKVFLAKRREERQEKLEIQKAEQAAQFFKEKNRYIPGI